MAQIRVFQSENGPFPSRSSWGNSTRHPEAPAGPTAPRQQWLRSHREGALLGTGRARRARCHSTCRATCTFLSMCPSSNPTLPANTALGNEFRSQILLPASRAGHTRCLSLADVHFAAQTSEKKTRNSCFKTLLELLELKKIVLCVIPSPNLPLFIPLPLSRLPLALLTRPRPPRHVQLSEPLSARLQLVLLCSPGREDIGSTSNMFTTCLFLWNSGLFLPQNISQLWVGRAH